MQLCWSRVVFSFNIFECILFFFVYLFICGAEMDNKIHYHNSLRRKWVLCLNAYFFVLSISLFLFYQFAKPYTFFVLNLKCMEINSFNIYHGSFVHISIEYFVFSFFIIIILDERDTLNEKRDTWKYWKLKRERKMIRNQKQQKYKKNFFIMFRWPCVAFSVVLLFELFVCYFFFLLPFRSMHSITCKLNQLVAYWMFIFAYETYL